MTASVLLTGHRDSVYDVAWAPDGSCLASAGRDCTLRIWDPTGAQLSKFEFSEWVQRVVFSHDGRLLAIGTNGHVEVRESSSSRILFQRESASLVESLIFLRKTGMLLVGSGEGLVQGWSIDGRAEVQYRTGQPLFSVRASPDESWLAIACQGRVLFLSNLEDNPLAVFEPGEKVDAYECVIAPDGETCAASLRLRRGGSIGHTENPDLFEIALWRPRLGEEPLAEENLVGHLAWVTSVDFCRNSPLLASASFDQSVRLWDYTQPREVAQLRGHGAAVYAARFSPSGDRLASCSADGTIRIWALDQLTQQSHSVSVVVQEPSSQRLDGVGTDDLLMRAERLADELVCIDSPKRLQQTIEATVQATDQEFAQALVQIGNVRSEQARREGNTTLVRRWRSVQTEVNMRGTDFILAEVLISRGGKKDVTPTLLAQLSKLNERQRKSVQQAAARYEKIVLGVTHGSISRNDARRRLVLKPLDPLAVFMAAGKLQIHLPNITAGHSDATGLRRGLEILAELLLDSTDPVLAATVFEMVGMLYCLMGDNLTGVSWLDRAASAARRGGWEQQLSSTVGNLGNALRNVGRLQDARGAYEECLDIALAGGLQDEFITHSSNLAIVYEDLGDFESAFFHLRRAVGVCRFLLRALAPLEGKIPLEFFNLHGRYSSCLGGLATVYREFGDDEGERECYEAAYEIDKLLNNRRGMAASLGNLAAIDLRNGRSQSAEDRYKASLAIAQELNNVDGQVHVLDGLSAIRRQVGLLDEAETLQMQAVRLAREHGLSQRLIVALCNLASLLQRRDRPLEAEAALKEAETLAARVRRELRASEEGPKIQEYVAQIADSLILLYLRSGQPVQAFETAERARAGVFLRQLSGDGKGTPQAYSVDEILRALRRVSLRAVLVSYYVLPDRVCMFVLRANEDQPHAAEVAVSTRELLDIRRDFERQVSRRFARTETEETWLRLSNIVLDPVLPHLSEDDLLLLAPHGPLHGLPLHALITRGRRLIETAAVAYMPSASALVAFAEQQLLTVRTCTVLGAHFTQEAKLVADVLGAESIMGEQLDKGSVLQALATSDVVHLSTHGFYVPDTPRRSGLVLHPSAETDAYLRALARPLALTWQGERLNLHDERERMRPHILDTDDLTAKRSRARLVTLSACETGLVRTDAADDPVGLVPTLLSTGVHGIVATLWLVDADTTAALMREFYTALKRPGGWDRIPYALRDAVNTIRKRYPHPYNWAPVLLVGGIGHGPQD